MASYTPVADIIILDTHNLKTIGVGDISYYPSSFTILNPTLEITPPEFPKVNIVVTAKGFTLLNSNDLQISCVTQDCDVVALPDGIWKIKYTFTPADTYKVEKTWLRADNLMSDFEKAFLSLDLSDCAAEVKTDDKNKLDNIWYFIQAAIAMANRGNLSRAMNTYRIASRQLSNYLNTKS
jgi:hypothetical protein